MCLGIVLFACVALGISKSVATSCRNIQIAFGIWLGNVDGTGSGDRKELLKWVWESIDNKWIGMGGSAEFAYSLTERSGIYSYIRTKTSIENQYLNLLYHYGIIGLISMIWVYIQVFIKSIIQAVKNPSEWEGRISFPKMLVVILGTYYISFFGVHQIDEKRIFFCLIFLLIAYCNNKAYLTAYLLSFFCAGEPSVNAQDELLKKMGTSRQGCDTLVYRGNGWPGFTTVNTKDGRELKMEYKVAWGQYLGRDIRYICRFCMDGTGELADIVCADFWQLDNNNHPDFSEHEGRNIIIARNELGKQLLDATVKSGRINVEEDFTTKIDSEFYLYQPAQLKRKGTMKTTITAMKLCRRDTPKYSKSFLNKYASHVDLKVKFDFFIGIIKRVIKGRL